MNYATMFLYFCQPPVACRRRAAAAVILLFALPLRQAPLPADKRPHVADTRYIRPLFTLLPLFFDNSQLLMPRLVFHSRFSPPPLFICFADFRRFSFFHAYWRRHFRPSRRY